MMNQAVPWVLPPLPRHPPPQPDEDLASLLMRTAERMGYDTPSWILRPEAPLPFIDPSTPIMWLRKAADYRLLEQFLHLDQAQVYRLTLHRFAARLQAPEDTPTNSPDEIQNPLLAQPARMRFFLPRQATQICPECLAEGLPYGRVAWYCQFVTVCLTHRRFLIRHCPVCAAPIPVFRLSLMACPICKKGDYRQAPTSSSIEHPGLFTGQTWLLQQLGIGTSTSTCEALDPLPAPLQPLQPWQYADLLVRFRYLLAPLLPAHPLLQGSPAWREGLPQPDSSVHKLSQFESAMLVATFHTLFVSWPTRFVAVLEALQDVNQSPEAVPGITQDFRAFYEHLIDLPADSALGFVSKAFAEYLGKHYTRGRIHRDLRLFRRVGVDQLKERPFLTMAQASRGLRIRSSTVRTLLQHSLLKEVPLPKRTGSRDTHVLIEKTSVEALQQAWGALLPLEHVAISLFGLPIWTMDGLARNRVLIPVRGPDVDGYPVMLYQPEDIERLTGELLSRAVAAQSPILEARSLVQLYRFQYPWRSLAQTVLAILEGHLTPIDLKNQEPLFQRLVVPRQRGSASGYENVSPVHHTYEIQSTQN